MSADLIARLEAAAEGSRELDVDILSAVSKTPRLSPQAPVWLVPRYTTSLDAALTLVPEGYWWELEDWRNDDGPRHRALVHKGFEQHSGIKATPELALCIAALKAREALKA